VSIPFFYIKEISSEKEIELDEENSKYIVQVLRMKKGEELRLTNGKGVLLHCNITNDHKKHCTVIANSSSYAPAHPKKSIAISLLKNTSRFEWFLEKATEIGVSDIFPLICKRTEKQKFRHDRMEQICISAMLQSQQCWLPVFHEVVSFENFLQHDFLGTNKMIAHCVESSDKGTPMELGISTSQLILIGPEGDFTHEEIETAKSKGYHPVSLGTNRLRSETAGIVAATLMNSAS